MTSTSQLVLKLKQADQDREFYPTDQPMIDAVKRYIPENADSIMDIGAGDGRVLAGLALKCPNAKLYGIELSQILIQAQPENVIPIGTDLHTQNLSCLQVGYIFCNPPYSEFEEWARKIVSEGFAKKAFLIIPMRWKESKVIEQAIKLRGATTRVIFNDDFLHADRPARAIVDIVEVTYPGDKWGDKVKDPFDIWFDANVATFDHAEFEESENGEDLARKFSNSNIPEMVAAYDDEYSRLQENYRAVFKLDYMILHELGINKEHVRDGLKLKMTGLKTKYWQILFDRLDAITSRLSTASKKKLLTRLTRNTSVAFTESNCYAVILWAIKNANEYFDSQLISLFMDLSQFESVLNYKSNVRAWVNDGWRYGNSERKNTHYALDYRIVVGQGVAIPRAEDYRSWDSFGGLSNRCHELIADVVAVMSNIGFSTHSQSSVQRTWIGGQWQDWYSPDDAILFQVKAHMNGNLHFRFAPEAIKALNIEAGRLLKWVRTAEDVVTEMGYTPQDAKKYFHSNSHILSSNVKLLEAPKS